MIRRSARPARPVVRLPAAIAGVFIAALVLLASGIQQTAHLTIPQEVSQFPEENVKRHVKSTEKKVEAKKTSENASEKIVEQGDAEIKSRLETDKNVPGQPNDIVERRDTQETPKVEAKQNAQVDVQVTEKNVQDAIKSNEEVTMWNASNATAINDTLPPKKVPPFTPSVRYLGVLVDAGRHFFPIEWLKELMDTLHALGFNLVHFRLTDDQAFNIQLKSHPELAKPTAVNNDERKVYTTKQLKDLVRYAKKRSIILMPEINVPGHAGAWSGIPGFLVPCPHFICEKGYGVPLNIANPNLLNVIRDVIEEVRDIFQTSPYLHLGGDEVEMSAACFQEAGIPMFNYSTFETTLEQILRELEIPPSHVMRWEFSNQQHAIPRAGKMTHYWLGHSYKEPTSITQKPFFVSQGLYFDSNGPESGWSLYNQANLQASLQNPPKAIIAGTFELSTLTWKDRNVLGRLLAVAMGASQQQYNTSAEFEKEYLEYCAELKFEVCSNVGVPVLSEFEFKNKWNEDWVVWKGDICNRLTVEHEEPIMIPQHDRKQRSEIEASAEFWTTFGIAAPSNVNWTRTNGKTQVASLPELAVNHVGLVVDLVSLLSTHPERAQQIWIMRRIIDDMAKLGFNLLQLRIMDNFGMALQLQSLSSLAFLTQGQDFWDAPMVRDLVNYANERGIKVMPEISISTRSGGWAYAGILAECPNVLCTSHGITIDTRDPSVMQIIAVALRELRGLFSSQYLHLGYDEREESKECYQEAGIKDPELDVWEQRLEAALRLEGILEENVLRWENAEGVVYPHRAGIMTNYRNVAAVRNSSVAFFVTTDLLSQGKGSAWHFYQRVRATAKAAPSGIMASIGVEYWDTSKQTNKELTEYWDSLMIKERMLTLAMGARKLTLNDEASFRASFTKTCITLGFQQCESFVNATMLSQQEASIEAEHKRQKIICQAHTVPRIIKKPRVGVLVTS